MYWKNNNKNSLRRHKQQIIVVYLQYYVWTNDEQMSISVSKCFNYTLQSEALNNTTINFILIPSRVCTEKIYNI